MNIRCSFALSAAAAAALAAPPPALAQGPTPAPPATHRACFASRDVVNFATADNRTVNIRAGVRRVFQLKLFAPCIGITFSQGIALRSRTGGFICEGTANAVEIVSRTATGPQRCDVTSVRQLSAEEIAALPKRQRP